MAASEQPPWEFTESKLMGCVSPLSPKYEVIFHGKHHPISKTFSPSKHGDCLVATEAAAAEFRRKHAEEHGLFTKNGEMLGFVRLRESGWKVSFTGEKRVIKYFSQKNYGGTLDSAKAAAEAWQRAYAIQHGLYYNRFYRYTRPDGCEGLCVEIVSDKYGTREMHCSIEHLELVENWIWAIAVNKAYRVKESTRPEDEQRRPLIYATSVSIRRKNGVSDLFHRNLGLGLACVDHIDGNGLNNWPDNLRDGANGINGANRRMQSNNTSGETGVRKGGTQYWKASVGKKEKSFPQTAEGFEAAVAWRQAEAALVGNTNGHRR